MALSAAPTLGGKGSRWASSEGRPRGASLWGRRRVPGDGWRRGKRSSGGMCVSVGFADISVVEPSLLFVWLFNPWFVFELPFVVQRNRVCPVNDDCRFRCSEQRRSTFVQTRWPCIGQFSTKAFYNPCRECWAVVIFAVKTGRYYAKDHARRIQNNASAHSAKTAGLDLDCRKWDHYFISSWKKDLAHNASRTEQLRADEHRVIYLFDA